jgi:hypothetical protein
VELTQGLKIWGASMFKKFVLFLLRPQWVVFQTEGEDFPELGLKIWGVIFALYKADVYVPESATAIRRPQKREFGESLHPCFIASVD